MALFRIHLTVSLLFPPQSESDEFVQAVRKLLCSPAESRPAVAHVGENCRLLQVKNNLLSLLWTEGFNLRGRHGL